MAPLHCELIVKFTDNFASNQQNVSINTFIAEQAKRWDRLPTFTYGLFLPFNGHAGDLPIELR